MSDLRDELPDGFIWRDWEADQCWNCNHPRTLHFEDGLVNGKDDDEKCHCRGKDKFDRDCFCVGFME